MLGDLHIHMVLDGADFRQAIGRHRAQPDDTVIEAVLRDYARREIFFLRDGGDAWDVGLRARELGRRYGIDYRTPAFPIHKKGHYGAFIGHGFATWEEYLHLLDRAERDGADFIKLMISGLIDFSRADTLTEPGLNGEEIIRMVEAAHARGFAVMVHANGDEPVQAAIEAKTESFEHGAYLSKQTLDRLCESETIWVPTLSTIGNLIGNGRFPDEVLTRLLRQQMEKIAYVAGHGGTIGLGSDAGAFCVLHGKAAGDEYDYLKAALGPVTEPMLHSAQALVQMRFHR